jgi:hypothetical protein
MRDVKQWKARSRKTVTAPSGMQYDVRAVPLSELTEIWGGLPGFLPSASDPAQTDSDRRDAWGAMLRDPERMRLVENIVARGVVDPQIGEGDDKVAVSEMPLEDVFFLMATIIGLSHMSDEDRARLRPTSSDPTSA